MGTKGSLCHDAVVAEWLRRLTRNQFRSAGVGSNPTDRDSIFYRIASTSNMLYSNTTFSEGQHKGLLPIGMVWYGMVWYGMVPYHTEIKFWAHFAFSNFQK